MRLPPDGFWTAIHEALAKGETPVCVLSYEHDLVAPAKKQPGRKKVREGGLPFSHYKAAKLVGGASHPRCVAPGCSVKLTRDQIVCSEKCRANALAYFHAALSQLEGPEGDQTSFAPLPRVGMSRPLPQAGDDLRRLRRERPASTRLL